MHEPERPLPCSLCALAHGVRLHRIHSSIFGATTFNPGSGASRFAPLRDIAGHSIPTLYAATTFAAAVFETIFHDIPPSALFKTVARATLKKLTYSVIRPRRALSLCGLFSADLSRWRLERANLIDTPVSRYSYCRLWAEAIHCDSPSEGLMWISRKFDEAQAIMLFGDRLLQDDLECISSIRVTDHIPVMQQIELLARRAGIVIVD